MIMLPKRARGKLTWIEPVSRTVVRQRIEAQHLVAYSGSVLMNQVGRSGKRICRKVEEASLREVSGEQIRWAKVKAALTPATPDLAIGGDFDCSEPEKVTNGDRHTPDPPDG
jgi:hypothetical protein